MSDKDYLGKKGGDNYKPLKFYQDRISGVANGFDLFSEGDSHYFTYNVDGEAILISETYTSVKGRDNGVNSVDKNRLLEARYKKDSLSSGKYFFNLQAGNHQEIATSAWFDDEGAMLAAIDRLMSATETPAMPVVDTPEPLAATPEAATTIEAAADLSADNTEAPTPEPVEPAEIKATRPATPEAPRFIPPVEEKKRKGLWWLLPIILFLLVWYLLSSYCCHDNESKSADSKLGRFFNYELPSGTQLNIPKKGIENRLIQTIEKDKPEEATQKWFNFDRIGFATNSAELSDLSMEQIDNIYQVLAAYPNVKLKIGGYTDNTGSLAYNTKLSQERAEAVMKALLERGVDAERLTAEGYGPEHPIASNDSAEGRALNRRIALRVTEK